MSKLSFNAIVLSRILLALLLISVVAIGALFYYSINILSSQVKTTNHAKIDNDLAEQNIAKLKTLRTYLDNNKDTVSRAADIVAQSQVYTYQNQGISDLVIYAQNSGVSIAGITYPAASTQTQENTAGSTIAGVKRVQMTIELSGAPSNTNVLKFIKYIEQNLTKMQINAVNLSPSSKDPQTIERPMIDMEIYVR